MKCDKKHMLLYAVTDRAWTGERTLIIYMLHQPVLYGLCWVADRIIG